MEKQIDHLEKTFKFIKKNIDDCDDAEIIKDKLELSDSLYDFIKIKNDKWFQKFFSMLRSRIDFDSFDDIIKQYKNNDRFVPDFITYLENELLIDSKKCKKHDKNIKNNVNIFEEFNIDELIGLRPNQINGLKNVLKDEFKTGVHNNIMGSGKSLLELMHIELFHKNIMKYQYANYMFISSRITIINGIFKNEKKINEYRQKKYFNIDNYNIIDLTNNNINHKNNILSKEKSNLIIVNTQYLQNITKNKKYLDAIKQDLKLIIFDECHNISAPTVFTFMKDVKKICPIIGFSATPIRTSKNGKDYFKNIFSINDQINIISTYDLFDGIVDDIILPFLIKKYEFKGVYNNNDDNDSLIYENIEYEDTDLNYNQEIIKNIFTKEIINLPYVKGIGWCKTIASAEQWKDYLQKNIPNINFYITHSGNDFIEENDEYNSFYQLKSTGDKINAFLLCVGKVNEGCDIDFVDFGIYLDAVKNKNIVSSLQSSGRISRIDTLYGKKKHAVIYDTYIKDKKRENNVMILETIINYYKTLLQLSEKNDKYYDTILNLHSNTVFNEKNNEIRIKIDNKKEHECVLLLNEKIDNWSLLKSSLSETIKKTYSNVKQNIELDKIKTFDFTKSKIIFGKINEKILIKNNFKSLVEMIYYQINNVDNILENNKIQIEKGFKEDKGFYYLTKLDISVQGADANNCIKESLIQCLKNNIMVVVKIKLSTMKTINIQCDKYIHIDIL